MTGDSHDATDLPPAEPRATGPTDPRGSENDPITRRAEGPLRHALARRLVLGTDADPDLAARRFLAAAPSHGIDPSLMWGAFDPAHPDHPLEVCLAVIGTGRTATLFLGPEDTAAGRTADERHAARVAAARAAIDHLSTERAGEVTLIQALPSPDETSTIAALESAGLRRIAELDYLRRDARRRIEPVPPEQWPAGATPDRLDLLGPPEAWTDDLLDTLDRSYRDTLDCPELCGLRDTRDVLASHRAVGRWNPSLWWLLRLDGRPAGCALLNPSPEQDSIELVYLGLTPEARGKGLAALLLRHAIARARTQPARWITCAVDRRNAPARKLYANAGFEPFTERTALVRAVARPETD